MKVTRTIGQTRNTPSEEQFYSRLGYAFLRFFDGTTNSISQRFPGPENEAHPDYQIRICRGFDKSESKRGLRSRGAARALHTVADLFENPWKVARFTRCEASRPPPASRRACLSWSHLLFPTPVARSFGCLGCLGCLTRS